MRNRLLALCLVIAIGLVSGCAAETMLLGKTDEETTSTTKPNKEKEDSKTVKIGGIEWYVDYDAALKIAKETNKPLWLHFGENPG